MTDGSRSIAPLRVAQVSFHTDVARRDANALMDAWPTLPAVAAAVQRTGVELTVVQAAHGDQTLRRDSVDYHFIHDARRVPSRLIDAVKSIKADVVHVQGLHHVSAIRELGRACRDAPLLIQDHGSLPPIGWRSAAWAWALRCVAGVAFTAREQAAPFIDARTFRADIPVFEVLEGSSTLTPGDQATARVATGLFGDPCLLWVGRLDANKDPLTMLAAIELAAERLPGLRMWCCYGKAPLLDVVKARIATSPALRERVTLLGTLPWRGVEAHYRAADIFVQASHREGSGYALLEAMACGTPAVVCDIPAARRIVGGTGAIVAVGNEQALADSIVDCWHRDAAAERLAVRRRFESALTFDAVGRELRGAYTALAQ